MPKIEIYRNALSDYINKKLSTSELEDLLPAAKAELDEVIDENSLKIELNDTNRRDLWSTAGLGRQLSSYLSGKIPKYNFFSNKNNKKDAGGRKIIIDHKLKDIRPYIAGFAVNGKKIDDSCLKDIIQTQEKLCWNFGRKRRSIAMGIYRCDLFNFPVRYNAVNPDKTKFIPLQMNKELSLRQILTEHPKGKDFGHIVSDYPLFPYLQGEDGGTLSFPPIINSANIGAVEIGDENLFIEMTGDDLCSLTLACSIVACDFADTGFNILPVEAVYPYDTPFGRSIVFPYYFQGPISMDLDYCNKLLGVNLTASEARQALQKMGIVSVVDGKNITITVPEYRNDFLHQVDIIEDVMIGRGMASFGPELPNESTIGRYTDEANFAKKANDIMIGLGFQEMIYNYLGSSKDYIEKMNINEEGFIRIANPMSENYEYVRKSIIPALLQSESVSGNAVYPHHIFEIGKTAQIDKKDISGTATNNYLGFLSADRSAGFNMANAHISAIMYYLNIDFEVEELDDPRFITGRAAKMLCLGKQAGIFGEIHPLVLENWGIQSPVIAAEINMDILLGVKNERKK